MALCLAPRLVAQDPPPPPPSQGQSSGQGSALPGGPSRGERQPGVFGKITAINGQSLEIATPRGQTVIVKLSADTQFRKDREAAQLSDFKVGDMVGVRGEENPDHSWTAQMVRSLANGGFGGGQSPAGGPGGPGMRSMGVLGQDYIVGQIKAVDAPSLTILRPDNVTQSIQLDENTSLRKGRDSITMADIRPGDYVFIRGAVANNVFQPKNVMLISPEQWKRMQEMNANGSGSQQPKPPQDNKPQNPPEQPH